MVSNKLIAFFTIFILEIINRIHPILRFFRLSSPDTNADLRTMHNFGLIGHVAGSPHWCVEGVPGSCFHIREL